MSSTTQKIRIISYPGSRAFLASQRHWAALLGMNRAPHLTPCRDLIKRPCYYLLVSITSSVISSPSVDNLFSDFLDCLERNLDISSINWATTCFFWLFFVPETQLSIRQRRRAWHACEYCTSTETWHPNWSFPLVLRGKLITSASAGDTFTVLATVTKKKLPSERSIFKRGGEKTKTFSHLLEWTLPAHTAPPRCLGDGVVQEARLSSPLSSLLSGSGESADEWYLPPLSPDGSLRWSRAAWALTQEQVAHRSLSSCCRRRRRCWMSRRPSRE